MFAVIIVIQLVIKAYSLVRLVLEYMISRLNQYPIWLSSFKKLSELARVDF